MRWSILIAVAAAAVASDVSAQTASPAGAAACSLVRARGATAEKLISCGPGTKIGDAIVEKPGMEQPRYYWDPVIAPSALAFYRGNLFPQWKSSALVGALAGQALFRLELGKDDKVVNEEPLLMDLGARIRDVQVFPDGVDLRAHRKGQRQAAEGDAQSGDERPVTPASTVARSVART